jgi:hypothetical protein|eukprot:COSAG01_NODE_2817_length_7018_cov_4.014017_1_plen_75_part_00
MNLPFRPPPLCQMACQMACQVEIPDGPITAANMQHFSGSAARQIYWILIVHVNSVTHAHTLAHSHRVIHDVFRS